MILTDIGEQAIEYQGREYIFRPSFYAMSQIGSPEEIVRCFSAVNGGTFHDLLNKLRKAEVDNEYTLPLLRRKEILGEILSSAILIMSCCCEDDVSELIGYYKPGVKGLVYCQGKIPQESIILLARELIRHGVVGDVKITGSGEYSSKFIVKDFVNLAQVHLEKSSEDAWSMTMTEFRQLMQVKFPPSEDTPSSERHDEVMAMRDRAEKARREKEKSNG